MIIASDWARRIWFSKTFLFLALQQTYGSICLHHEIQPNKLVGNLFLIKVTNLFTKKKKFQQTCINSLQSPLGLVSAMAEYSCPPPLSSDGSKNKSVLANRSDSVRNETFKFGEIVAFDKLFFRLPAFELAMVDLMDCIIIGCRYVQPAIDDLDDSLPVSWTFDVVVDRLGDCTMSLLMPWNCRPEPVVLVVEKRCFVSWSRYRLYESMFLFRNPFVSASLNIEVSQ